jgi:hypothetical protein
MSEKSVEEFKEQLDGVSARVDGVAAEYIDLSPDSRQESKDYIEKTIKSLQKVQKEQRSSADLSTYLIHRLKAVMNEHELGQITNIVLVPSKGLGLSSCLKAVQTHGCLCCTYEKIYMFKFLMRKDKKMWTLDVSMD